LTPSPCRWEDIRAGCGESTVSRGIPRLEARCDVKNEALFDRLRGHLEKSLKMLENVIASCPDQMWYETHGGFPLWHQVYHAIESINYWFCIDREKYARETYGKKITDDLGQRCDDVLTKAEIDDYFSRTGKIVDAYFNGLERDAGEDRGEEHDIAKIDEIIGQIRHIQYHIGHCNAIFRESGIRAVDWE
jgi:hypothetical protein